MVGTHSIKAWSRTQALIALSSGESELYASLKIAAEALGILSMAKDFAWNLRGEVWGDASAALGIINRKRARKKQDTSKQDCCGFNKQQPNNDSILRRS